MSANTVLKEDDVIAWLDEHPDVFEKYCSSKAKTRRSNEIRQSLIPASSLQKKGSVTAQQFERCAQKPMINFVDGKAVFYQPDIEEGNSCEKFVNLTSSEAKEVAEALPKCLMSVCNELDVRILCHKILKYTSTLLNAQFCSFFLVETNPNTGDKELVGSLLDVTAASTVETCTGTGVGLRFPIDRGIAGYIATTGETCNIPDAYQDKRFNQDIDKKLGSTTKSILGTPVKKFDGEVIGVAQAINKMSGDDVTTFTEQDEQVFKNFIDFCGIGLSNADLYERSRLEIKRNQLLLDLVQLIFEQQDNIEALIYKIMRESLILLQCSLCQILIVSPHSAGDLSVAHDTEGNMLGNVFSRIFELSLSEIDIPFDEIKVRLSGFRYNLNLEVLTHVATTGEKVNIHDSQNDARFTKNPDSKTRSQLCMPILVKGSVIGVAQLVNKLDGTHFNINDEHMFEAFALFCGLGLLNTEMYETAVKAIARRTVAEELILYHTAPSKEELQTLMNETIPEYPELGTYEFDDKDMSDDATMVACLRMFDNLKVPETLKLEREVLCRWLITVRKNYRKVVYHNWRHAFNVAQSMYCMIMNTNTAKTTLTSTEHCAMFIAALCHDLDHRGTTSQFQIKAETPLAQAYANKNSIMERHHFDLCIMILNTEGCELFSHLQRSHYKEMVELLEELILATDLQVSRPGVKAFKDIIKNKQISTPEGKKHLRAAMMTAADLSAICKPFKIQCRIACLVASEFFRQGDMERRQLDTEPDDLMDRMKKHRLPTLQVGFINFCCLPVFEPLLDGCNSNKESWTELSKQEDAQLEWPTS